MHDVARIGVNVDLAAWALKNLPLHSRKQSVAAALATRLFQRVVNHACTVVAKHGHRIGAQALVGSFEGFHKLLVHGRRVGRGIGVRGNDTQRSVAHAVQNIVVHHIARADHADARLGQAALVELVHHLPADARGHKNKQCIGRQVTYLLQKRCKIGAAHRHAQRLKYRSAVENKAVTEGALSVQARAVVRHHGHHFFDAVLGCPVRNAQRNLRQGKRHAHHVGRSVNHRRSSGQHIDHGRLGLRGDWCGSERQRREAKARQHVHFVVHHHLLRKALGHVWRARVVTQDQLDFSPCDQARVLRHIQAHTGFHLPAGGRKRPRHRGQ